jgi:hypothetical protein
MKVLKRRRGRVCGRRRRRGLGGIDIWVARRESPDDSWGAPENLGAPVNSPANDFCPTIDHNDHTRRPSLW